MEGAQPCNTPISNSTKLSKYDGILLENPKEYRSLVGALQYLTWTRPDLSFVVNLVCQHMQSILEAHIWLPLSGFSDMLKELWDLGCISLRGVTFYWSSKKQTTIARSSTEAEYRTLAHSAADVVWIFYLLQDLMSLYQGFRIARLPGMYGRLI
ncbi:uncharacterized protein LOC113271953 [Papaver somniferum]|uniref:uncharacterized protein LOC113271953 n=1 Tax=Papaver somniferum TaxID=3469 RepID=UPI000E6FA3D3|nr:uncharacterized protein LOC113271953 [Papaver somniferum]